MLEKERNKKAILIGPVIFIILNILFFILLLIFVVQSSTGRLTYEAVYAKKIALAIDQAKQDTNIVIDVNKVLDIGEKHGISRNFVISIDNDKKEVVVKTGIGGYRYKFFTNSVVSYSIKNSGNLILEIR